MSGLNQLLNTANLDINSLISHIPGYLIIKDLDLIYLGGNLNAAKEFNLKHPNDLYGLTNYTVQHSLSEIADFIVSLDHEAIQHEGGCNSICAYPFNNEVIPVHINKQLLRDRTGKKIAIYSHAQHLTDPRLFRMVNHLIETHPTENWKNQRKTRNCFTFNKNYPDMPLSELTSACLYFLIRQKSKSDIARILKTTRHHVDECIHQLKEQLHYKNTSDLIDIAIEKNFINIVPTQVFAYLYSEETHGLRSFMQNNRVKLTEREKDCVRLLLAGNKIKDIAMALQLSPRTVETHMNHLKKKLSCRDKCELVMKLKDIF